MNWLKHTLSVLGTMVVVMAVAAVIFPTRASALVATLIRDVDNPARDTFQGIAESVCSGSVGTESCNGLTLPTVNGAGASIAMVVLEYVSVQCSGNVGYVTNYSNAQINSVLGGLATTPATSTSGYFFQVLSSAAGSSFSQTTRLYAAPGSTLAAPGLGNNSTCILSVSGYMVTP
jgi:type IV secretory pathway VirB6-like protein